jgi:hypothetical protein
MSLYIPPYAQPARAPSPSPSHLPPSSSFSELGLPPGHNRTNSYPVSLRAPTSPRLCVPRSPVSASSLPCRLTRIQPPVAGQPSYPPSSVASFASNSSTSTITPQHLQSAVDALARPMSSMSLGPTFSSRPLPSATPVPPDHSSSLHAYAAHRHSVGGQADAPWATLIPGRRLPTTWRRGNINSASKLYDTMRRPLSFSLVWGSTAMLRLNSRTPPSSLIRRITELRRQSLRLSFPAHLDPTRIASPGPPVLLPALTTYNHRLVRHHRPNPTRHRQTRRLPATTRSQPPHSRL